MPIVTPGFAMASAEPVATTWRATSYEVAPALAVARASPVATRAQVAVQVPARRIETPSPIAAGSTTNSARRDHDALRGRRLKAIADRHDFTADDLGQRYRRLRLQDAITSPAKQVAAARVLVEIDRDRRVGSRDARRRTGPGDCGSSVPVSTWRRICKMV